MGGKKTEILHFDIEEGRTIDLPVAVVSGDSQGPEAVVTAGIHGRRVRRYFRRDQAFPRALSCRYKRKRKVHHGLRHGVVRDARFAPHRRGGEPQTAASRASRRRLRAVACGEDPRRDQGRGLPHRPAQRAPRRAPPCRFRTYHRGRSGALNDGSHEIAYYYGIPNIVITETEGRWQDKGTCYASVYENIGIPSALVQTGTATGSENVRRHIAGLMNVLRRFGTLKGSTAAVGRPQIYESMEWIYAKRSGLYTAAAAVGDKVRRGQMIGFIADSFGHAGRKDTLSDQRAAARPGGQRGRREKRLCRKRRRDEIKESMKTKSGVLRPDGGTPSFLCEGPHPM